MFAGHLGHPQCLLVLMRELLKCGTWLRACKTYKCDTGGILFSPECILSSPTCSLHNFIFPFMHVHTDSEKNVYFKL